MQDPLTPTNLNSTASPQLEPAEPVIKDDEASRQAAADLIRQKVAAAYGDEPSAKQELAEVASIDRPRSKHQAYMQQLSQSGKSLVEIQTAWHNYYAALPHEEKYQVWQEFYSGQSGSMQQPTAQPAAQPVVNPQPPAAHTSTEIYPTAQPIPQQPVIAKFAEQPAVQPPAAPAASQSYGTLVRTPEPYTPPASTPTAADIKQRILNNVSGSRRISKNNPLRSLAFGLGTGMVVIAIFLFSFFNEVFLAPFIQPSRMASETPVIVDPASAVVGQTTKVIIPKINVEIPVDYSQTSTDEKTFEKALDTGVVHYPTTVRPGQAGNAAFFGHSSNNIFNPGKYKFAFVLLHELVEGDTFYLTYEGKVYVYRMISRRVVEPTEISVLGPIPGKTATATLITCDPPGTSLKRLVVVGEQISPAPGTNVAPPAPAEGAPILSASQQTNLPGNGPTLWSRLWGSVF